MRRAATALLCLTMPMLTIPMLTMPMTMAGDGGFEGKSDPGRGFNLYSVEREMALGKQLAAEVERQVKFADDVIVAEYVNRVAQNLARRSEVILPVSVRIIESGDLNAFTLPGGHIYINGGMLRLTESEAELAFILAHELGHVAARHATREASRSDVIKLSSFPLAMIGGWTGFGLGQAAAPTSKLGLLKGEREFELQADRLGVDFLEAAGYDPQAAIDVFERIAAKERKTPGRLAKLSGTHPITSERIDQTQKYLNQIAGRRPEYIINTSEYEQMRLRLPTSWK